MTETRESSLRRFVAYNYQDKQARARMRWAKQLFNGDRAHKDDSLQIRRYTSKEAFIRSAVGGRRDLLNDKGVSMVIFDRDAAGQVYAVRYWQRSGDDNDREDQPTYHAEFYENGMLIDKEA